MPDSIKIRGARVHNLKNINIDIPLNQIVGVAGIENGATVIVIEHDLDVIRNADYVIDMGPGGGDEGGRIVAAGTPEEVRRAPQSVTGKYL